MILCRNDFSLTPTVTPGGEYLSAVCFGNGQFVAVALGLILASPDGVTWTRVFHNYAFGLTNVRFLNGAFYAIGANYYLRSTDGVTWTSTRVTIPTLTTYNGVAVTGATTFYINDMLYNAGTYFAIGSATLDTTGAQVAAILTSTDGLTWVAQNTTTITTSSNSLKAISFVNGHYAITGLNNGYLATSTDGATWTVAAGAFTTNSDQLKRMVYANSLYVIGGSFGDLYSSPDLVTWTKAVAVDSGNYMDILVVGTTIYAVSDSGFLSISTNGTTWTLGYPMNTNPCNGIAYSGTTFVIVAANGTISHSADGQIWSTVAGRGPQAIAIYGAATNGTRLVGYSGGGFVTSDDLGATWTGFYLTPAGYNHNGFASIAYGASLYVAVDGAGAVYTSPTGVTWTARTSNTVHSLLRVRFVNALFVAVGITGTIITSPDGITWTVQPTPVTSTLRDIAYGVSKYVVVGDAGVVLTSTNLTAWTQSAINAGTSQLFSMAYDGSVFVVSGGNPVALATSPDAVTWTAQAVTDLAAFNHVFYDGVALYAVGGSLVWTSTNHGVNWSSVMNGYSGTTINYLGITKIGTKFLVFMGNGAGNYIYSSDGVTWYFAAGQLLGATAFDGTTYFAFGQGSVQTSTDMVTWTQPKIITNGAYVREMAYGAGVRVAVGDHGLLLTSTDGVSWTWNRWAGAARSLAPYALNAIVWTGAQFVAVGGNGTIITSPDGNTWTTRTSSNTTALTNLAFGNGKLVSAFASSIDTDGHCLSSADGITWTDTLIPGQGASLRYTPTNLSFDGTNFQIVGQATVMPAYTYNALTIRTPDGVTFTAIPITNSTANLVYRLAPTAIHTFSVSDNGAVLDTEDGTHWQPLQTIWGLTISPNYLSGSAQLANNRTLFTNRYSIIIV